MDSSTSPTTQRPLEVAIIGGGITGLALAMGLQARGVKYKVYERASAFRELGAGVGFSPNAERAMIQLNEDLHRAFRKVTNANGEDYFQWMDGYSTGKLIYKLYLGKSMFQGCRRSDFIDELTKLIPKSNIVFGKQAESILEEENGRTSVIFQDQDYITADIADSNRLRRYPFQGPRLLLGEDNPASHPGYTHKYCFRALIGTSEAMRAIGENGRYYTSTRFMYNGPGAHVITYPVAKGTFLNVLVVLSDPKELATQDGKHICTAQKLETVEFFRTWEHHAVRALIDLLPEELDKWAIFDMLDSPAKKYNERYVAIAGDAAHAAGPHLGAGAGFGVEDGLVLATAIDSVDKRARTERMAAVERAQMCSQALSTYNHVRYDRTQWLISATREACSLFHADPSDGLRDALLLEHGFSGDDINPPSNDSAAEFQHQEGSGTDPYGNSLPDTVSNGQASHSLPDHENQRFGRRISALFHTIWNYDINQMVESTIAGLLEPSQTARGFE